MAAQHDFSASSAQKLPKLVEKSNFSQTCSLLSQYLKQKGSFGDLSLGITRGLDETNEKSESLRPKPTMNLLPKIEESGDKSEEKETFSDQNLTLMPNPEPENVQMTIFYAGKVYVFDNFPAEKAKEVMTLAGTAVPPRPTNLPTSTPNFASSSDANRWQPHALDLPIARKASLHRFLEKRKERIICNAPYKVYREDSTSSTSQSPAATDSQSWLGLAASRPN